MDQNSCVHIYNSTQETVKICLQDTNNIETNAVILADQIWKKTTEDGWNSVTIIPLNDIQNTFTYTLESRRSLIIKRKLGVLVLIPSRKGLPTTEVDLEISGHSCLMNNGASPFFPTDSCYTTGCLVFNETHEPILVSVTDHNQRNTHIVLDHLEHNIVTTPHKMPVTTIGTSIYFPLLGNYSTDILVSVLDFNQINNSNLVAIAKYSINSQVHQVNQFTTSEWVFLRVVKIDGHLTIENDTFKYGQVRNSANAPYSYLLSKQCLQKIQSLHSATVTTIKTSQGTYDVIPTQSDSCCIS